MKDLIEIRWHGRGGQGAKTAALLLADVAFNNGLYVQGFPEYGPERMGAPITAYNRLSRTPIRVHSNIYEPDYVVVVDESLIEGVDVTAGIKEGGAIIINSSKNAEELKPILEEKGYHGQIYTIDARKISIETLGKYFPNSPMLAAVVKITGVMEENAFLEDMRKSYAHKFASKPSVIDGNMKALEIAFKGGTLNMKTDIRKQDIDVTWQDLNPGAVVTGGATAPEFNTGEWRVNVPVLDMEKCKQCLLCVPVCPDSSIPVKDQKREDFDLMHCKGCGICAKVCPFGAITMKEGDE